MPNTSQDEVPKAVCFGVPMAFTVSHAFARSDGRTDVTSSNMVMLEGERRLVCFKLPTWQRGLVWTKEQQVRLIESLWMGLPIASYVFNRVDYKRHPLNEVLVDGQQRWSTIDRYVRGEFEVMGRRYPELSTPNKFRFMNLHFAAIQTKITDERDLKDLYDRLAYGGTAHS